jgi:hypothetical protein
VIAIKVGPGGGRLRLRNTCGLRPSFADLARRDGDERRVILGPGQTKDVQVGPGMLFVTCPPAVVHDYACNA